MRDLGLLTGDGMSQAYAINNKGQVVGTSCIDVNYSDCHAFIWQNGVMTNLNDLVPPNSLQGVHMALADSINDLGEIVGGTFRNGGVGDGPGFILYPCDALHQNIAGCQTAATVSPTMSLRAR